MRRSITAKFIAARLGISQPTVSRALSDNQAHLVAPETRAKVLEMARQLGYRPNPAARALRQRRTGVMGFLSGYGYVGPDDDFLTQIIGGLQRACNRARMDLLLHGPFRGHATEDIVAQLMRGMIDGLILHTSASDPLVERVREVGLPVVAIADVLPHIPSVVAADADGMRLALEHLWKEGHRHIAFSGPDREMASVKAREKAYLEFLREKSVQPLALAVPFDGFAVALRELRLAEPRPTAVCCWNDMFAYGLLRECRRAGVTVPGELAVIGFDGFLDLKFPAQQLTTVQIPWQTAADHACRMLMDRVEGKGVPEQVVVPVSLYLGDTA